MNWAAVIWAGFLATILMIASIHLLRLAGPGLPFTTLLGCLFRSDPHDPKTETLGYALLLGLGSTVLAGLYAWLLEAIAEPSWVLGCGLGLVQGLLLAAALPWIGTITACVRRRVLPPPGRFGMAWGRGTPITIVGGHLVYGGVLGGILASF